MPMYRRSLYILLMLVVLGLGGTMYGYYTSGDAITLDTAEKTEERREERLTVYVTGAVNQAGVVTLPGNARVLDAVNACGGMLPTADADNVNLAQPLRDGQQIRVPTKVAAPQPAETETLAKSSGRPTPPGAKVNINTADEASLDTLPGIGPATAKRIIDYRQSEGPFQTLEDLKKVRGIGEAKFAKLKDMITL